jgi:hypothetical protein
MQRLSLVEELDLVYNSTKNRRALGNEAYLNTVRNPPRLTIGEGIAIQNGLSDLLFLHASSYDLTADEKRYYYHLCSSGTLEDRTAKINLHKMGDCTVELVKQIQLFLAASFPLWRCAIFARMQEAVIIVYPSRIRFGDLDEADTRACMAQMIELDNRAETSKNDLEAQQHRLLVDRINRVKCDESPVIGLMVFDSPLDKEFPFTAWTLQRMNVINVTMTSPEDYSMGDFYNVKSDGEFGSHVPENGAEFGVQQWWLKQLPEHDKLIFRATLDSENEFNIEFDVTNLVYQQRPVQKD